MRIAVSGTHGSGKTTLAHDFVAAHREYAHEPEPYEALAELEPLGVLVEDFHRQLELSVETLCGYAHGANVIVERSPLDFIAYMLALDAAPHTIESAKRHAARGLERLDLLVVLPLNDRDGITEPESEDPELREAMNEHLLDLITSDLVSGVRVVEIHGSRKRRLEALTGFAYNPRT